MAQIFESTTKLDIPTVDLPTLIFSSNTQNRSIPQYFHADNPAINFNLDQAEVWVKRWAKGLQDLGLAANDKVLLYSGNSLYFPVLFWGTIASGGVFSGCSPGSSVIELAYQLKDSDSRVLLADPACLDNAFQAADQVGLPRERVFVFSAVDDATIYPARRWTEIWAPEADVATWKWRRLTTKEEVESTTAIINYSSGTTGLPKGVEISHYNAVSNSVQIAYKHGLVAPTAAGRARRARIDLSGERWLAPLPMFHAYGQAYFCTVAAIMGSKVFVMPKYDINKYLLYLDIYRITFLTGVPTLLVSVAKHPRASSYNLKAIENVLTGSAPLGAEIGKLVQEIYLRPGVLVKQGWGLTETTCSATSFLPDETDDGRSIGRLLPNIRGKIAPISDYELEDNQQIPYTVGEIWVSGPNIMKGYYKKPEATANAIIVEGNDRWFRTGDVGYVDDTGRFYIIDRMKELIKVKGLQVAPAEIEQTLLTNPGIKDAAVVGIKRSGAEYPKAFVVRQDHGRPLTERDVQKHVEDRLSKHKWLTAGVEFIDEIPRTASGKVMRRKLTNKPPKIGPKL